MERLGYRTEAELCLTKESAQKKGKEFKDSIHCGTVGAFVYECAIEKEALDALIAEYQSKRYKEVV